MIINWESSTEDKMAIMQDALDGIAVEGANDSDKPSCVKWGVVKPDSEVWDFAESMYRRVPVPHTVWKNIYKDDGGEEWVGGSCWHTKAAAFRYKATTGFVRAAKFIEVKE